MNERHLRVVVLVLSFLLFGAIAATVVIGLFVFLPRFQASQSPPTPTPTAFTRGEKLYNENCLVCHGGATGGAMMDYPPRHNANGHTWHHPDCQLTNIILNGRDEMTDMMRQMMNVPTTVPRMPAWKDKLTNEDIAAILAYIKTWWTEDERQAQARITQDVCKGQ